jgi:hypothetical protein
MALRSTCLVVSATVLLASCAAESALPNTPGDAATGITLRQENSSSTHGLELRASPGGPSYGIVNVTSSAAGPTTFHAQINFNVHGLAPNTSYALSRASEFGHGAVDHDGICQRAAGLAPWVGLSRFSAFPVTLTTDAEGDGSAHVVNETNVFPDGSQFDVMFRVSSGTTDLRTACVTVDVK